MMIYIYYGPKKEFEKLLPDGRKKISLIELASKSDAQRRVYQFIVPGNEQPKQRKKKSISCLVTYSDEYSGISETAIQSFVSFLNEFKIGSIYLQNPPKYICEQLKKTDYKISYKSYEYTTLTMEKLKVIYDGFSERIIGQPTVEKQLVGALYPLAKGRLKKPVVIMFYGPSGVGKTESAKYMSEILGENLFRKQFSMFQNNDFADYIFGGKHYQNSFSRELLERESNIILLDEFDKPNPIFYSAFYQLFDEGIYTDKNYAVRLENSIIICTSNFMSEDNMRNALGDPIYSRFDAIIQFKKLSIEAVKIIIDREYHEQTTILEPDELKIIKDSNLLKILKENAGKLRNVRHIKKVIREAIVSLIIDKVFNEFPSHKNIVNKDNGNIKLTSK